MKYLKKFEQYTPEEKIGKDIVVVKPSNKNLEEKQTIIKESIINNDIIGKNIVKVIPGKDKIYLNHKFDK
jgi:hypothetical protein